MASPTRRPMSPLLSPRLAATFALAPLTWGVFIAVFYLVLEDIVLRHASAEVRTAAIVGSPLATFYLGSLGIWWRSVRWTWGRLSTVAAVTLVLAAAFAGATSAVSARLERGITLAVGVATIGGPLALILINRVCWSPARPAKVCETVPCPHCGHDLRDVGRCACPQCGGSFTLAQLVEATHVADAIGITQPTAKEVGTTR